MGTPAFLIPPWVKGEGCAPGERESGSSSGSSRHHQEELRLSHNSYLRQHPEAQALISDFLLFLLLRQPVDVVTFAAEYFGPFAKRRSPTPALRSSNRPSPFRELEPKASIL